MMDTIYNKPLEKEIGIIGLGKMGQGIALQLAEKGWNVIVYNRSAEKTKEISKIENITATYSLEDFMSAFTHKPRIIWIMLTAGTPVEEMIFGETGIQNLLEKDDIVIDAGNSFFKDAKPRAEKLAKLGVSYLDIGVSGGPSGARNGACLMIGGAKILFTYLEDLYKTLSIPQGYAHFEGAGAGHFVKMVHNGIEYGMMQAIGEGFNIMKKSDYNLDLQEVSRIYNTGSVIESRLIGWLEKAYIESGVDLAEISGSVNSTGEGEWTVKTAEEMKEPVPVIKDSFVFRQESKEKPSYVGQVVSALRGQFGGHAVKK